MTLLAAFKVLLHRYSGQEDIIIGGVTDTRRRSELQNVVGYFLNSLVSAHPAASQLPFREFLAQVGDAVVGALSASDVPFDHIVREVQPKRELGAHPLFQVLFSVQPPAPVLAEGWDLTQMDVASGTAKFDLYLELDERSEGHDRAVSIQHRPVRRADDPANDRSIGARYWKRSLPIRTACWSACRF